MKRSGLWLSVLVASCVSASAQITIEVTQDQDNFLPGESLPVAVRITNRSGQTLRLGGEEDWLTFAMASTEGSVVAKLGEVPVVGSFELEPSKVAIKRLDLEPYFTLLSAGRYGVVASVRVKGWDQEFTSQPRYFDVIEGARLWEQEVGIPRGGDATNSIPEVRRYMLQQANYIRSQLRLYLRVTDTYGRTVRVAPIGPMVSFGQPEPHVDRLSHLHLLYQFSPRSYSYTSFNFDGELLARRTYDLTEKRPRLRMDEDGNVSVVGGVRRVTPNDFPPPPPESLEENQPATNTPPPAPSSPTNKPSATKKKSKKSSSS